jgi:sugar/nucleoside kinase (ribokinase family)
MNSTKQFDCIAAGDVFVDLVMSGFTSLPRLGEEAFADELRREIGGGAAITARGLSQLGARTSILAMVGQSDGQWLLDRLKDRGVETSGIRFHLAEPTGLTVAASTAEDRAFLTYNGANRFLKELLNDPRVHEQMARARHIHFALPIDPALLSMLTGKLHDAGCGVSVDVGWRKDWLEDERNIEALANVDLFLPNEREAAAMTGQSEPEAMLQSLAAMGVSRVALKRGARGALLLWDDEIIECPPHRVRSVDTTGAGDCFDAGFIYGLLQGESPERCLQIANLCGALSTESLGGIASFPDRDRVLTRLHNS